MLSLPESYFSLVPDRHCGECMVCCEYLSINTSNFKKPADTLCQNCVADQGCRIYHSRPSVCRTWHCLWRRHPGMPEALRPDKCKAVFSLKVCFEPRQMFENAYIVCMTLTDPSVFDTPAVSEAIDMFIKEKTLPVWLSYGGSKTLVWPSKEMADAIDHPSVTQHRHLIEPGKTWLNQFNDLLEPLQDHQLQFNQAFLHN